MIDRIVGEAVSPGRPAAPGYPSLETRIMLRIEGGVAAAVAVYLFGTLDVSWWLFTPF
jgi:hypothetical protein